MLVQQTNVKQSRCSTCHPNNLMSPALVQEQQQINPTTTTAHMTQNIDQLIDQLGAQTRLHRDKAMEQIVYMLKHQGI